jgi:hypothetical protein
MLNSIQNQELTRMVNKIVIHTESFVNYQVESISSDRKYKDGVFTLATDEIRLLGVIQGKALIHINYRIEYNVPAIEHYKHIMEGYIITQDENGHPVFTDIPKDFGLPNHYDIADGLSKYLKTTLL